MQSIRECIKHLALYSRSVVNRPNILSSVTNLAPACSFHTSAICRANLSKYRAPTRFLNNNKTIFPPQQPGEERRPAVSYKLLFKNLLNIKLLFTLYICFSVCMPYESQYKVQSKEDVVHLKFCARNVRGRSCETVEFFV